VPEDVPEAFDYQKNGKSEREYVDADRIKVTAGDGGFIGVGLDYKSNYDTGQGKERGEEKSVRNIRIFFQAVTAND
jgi:hypothetical protein